jgi:hypothetical protein
VNQARPVFSYERMLGQFRARYPFQTGIWPLASDGRTVDMCIAVEDYLKLRHADLRADPLFTAC